MRSRADLVMLLCVVSVIAGGCGTSEEPPNPPDANTYYNRGLAWHQKGDYDKAIEDYTEAVRLDPTLAVAYYNRGLSWKAKGDTERAEAHFAQYRESSGEGN